MVRLFYFKEKKIKLLNLISRTSKKALGYLGERYDEWGCKPEEIAKIDRQEHELTVKGKAVLKNKIQQSKDNKYCHKLLMFLPHLFPELSDPLTVSCSALLLFHIIFHKSLVCSYCIILERHTHLNFIHPHLNLLQMADPSQDASE